MTYEEIVKETQNTVKDQDASMLDGHLAVQIDIIGEGEGAFYIELKDGEIFVEPYEYYDHDCKFIMKGKDFLKMMNNELDPVAAFGIGKLRVEGSIEKALEFKNIVDTLKSAEKKAKKAEKEAEKAKKAEKSEKKEKKAKTKAEKKTKKASKKKA